MSGNRFVSHDSCLLTITIAFSSLSSRSDAKKPAATSDVTASPAATQTNTNKNDLLRELKDHERKLRIKCQTANTLQNYQSAIIFYKIHISDNFDDEEEEDEILKNTMAWCKEQESNREYSKRTLQQRMNAIRGGLTLRGKNKKSASFEVSTLFSKLRDNYKKMADQAEAEGDDGFQK